MFLNWILDQQDREDATGSIARVIWKDINNGCGSTYFRSSRSWLNHFEDKHTKILTSLKPLLAESYLRYLASYEEDNRRQ
jgi:hypothetical protein